MLIFKRMIKNNPAIYHFCLKIVEKTNEYKYYKAKKGGKEKIIGLISREYKRMTGEKLRNPPVSYTEKMQFYKILYASKLKGNLTDKYLVREWVRNKIGEDYLIPLLGVWGKFEEVDFDSLPTQFVLKTNHGSGTNFVVTDKEKIDYRLQKKQFNYWLKENFAFSGRGFEMHYSYIKPRILAEKYVADREGKLNDYKFLCFNGKPCFCWVDIDRFSSHRRYVFDMNWTLQKWNQFNYETRDEVISKPENFDEMIKIVTTLCKDFSQVRVDLYNVDGKIYFGEMTFTNGKGYELIYPKESNDEIGMLWDLNYEKEDCQL